MRSSRPRLFLELDQATFRLGERLVFPNTTWHFGQGEHWAVLGGNGSGKSLLADALRGRLPVVQGELRYWFRAPEGLSPEEAIGHVSFEDRKQQVHGAVAQSRWNSIEEEGALKVRDYLSYASVMEINPFEVNPGRRLARQRFERRARRAVWLLSLAPLLEHTLLCLSNGERQRVELARALCRPLRLLILDQPFTGLDKQTREHFRHMLEQLMGTAVRVLLLTTRPEDLPAHITHVMRLEDCRVVASGARQEIVPLDRVRYPAFSRSLVGRGSRRALINRAGPGTPIRSSSATAEERNRRGVSSEQPDQGSAGASPHREWRNADFVRASPYRKGRGHCGAVLVEMRNVSVRYGGRFILKDLSWEIRAGESWALLGPNGSGKTTLLGLILGDHPQAYTNDVRVFGQRCGEGVSVWHLKRRIGWVSPELHLYFDDSLTCLEVVASGFHSTVGVFERLTDQQRRAARAALTRFGLRKFADTPLVGLSAGLQRMVLLARALVKKPPLLILDEPCQGLDAAHRELFLTTVDRLIRSGGVTVIYVTHRQEEIPSAVRSVLRLSGNNRASRQAKA